MEDRPSAPGDAPVAGGPRRALPALVVTAATTLVVIAAVAGVYLALRPSTPGRSRDAPTAAQPAGTELVEGEDYRVLVAVVRVKARNPEGERWDSGARSRSAPDPFYEIWWRGNRVYKSKEVDDVLVASWSNVALPDLYELLAGRKLSLETIRQGVLITAHRGDEVRVRIYDDDPFKNDLIEELRLPVGELRVGDTVRAGRRGLENVTLRVIPRDVRQLEHLIR